MKHSHLITFLILTSFFLSQIIGLVIVNQYIDHPQSQAKGETVMKPLPGFERPQVENKSTSFVPITIAILIGTALIFLIIKFKKPVILRVWFFLVIWLCLAFAFYAFIPSPAIIVLALFLALWKIFRPNILVHNFTELFIYGGLAAIFVDIINVFAAFMLLAIISVYDAIAVWKTKHMVALARFQADSKVFAGLFIPYNLKGAKSQIKLSHPKKAIKTKKHKVAVLGGGDVGFPLIFAGVVMKGIMLIEPVTQAFLKTLVIPVFATIALYLLLHLGEKDKFYPAMPFISAGCFVGYLIFLLL